MSHRVTKAFERKDRERRRAAMRTGSSLAALKRRIAVGTVIEAMPGHPWTESVGQARTVRIVQTNAFAADKLAIDSTARLGQRDQVSWLYWPHASEVTYDADAGTFVVRGMPYRIVQDAS